MARWRTGATTTHHNLRTLSIVMATGGPQASKTNLIGWRVRTGLGGKKRGAWPDEGRVEEGEELGEEGAELGAVNEDDVYVQLAQKEQDLMLAAELGNALLEKNQELEQQVAKLTDEFSRKVEVRVTVRNTFTDTVDPFTSCTCSW